MVIRDENLKRSIDYNQGQIEAAHRILEEYLSAGFKEVYAHPIIIHRVLILSHEPLAMSEDMPYYNLHGHTHDRDNMENEDKRRNVSVEKTGFYPVNLGKIRNEVLKKMNAKPVKSDLSKQARATGEPAVKNRATRKAVAMLLPAKAQSDL